MAAVCPADLTVETCQATTVGCPDPRVEAPDTAEAQDMVNRAEIAADHMAAAPDHMVAVLMAVETQALTGVPARMAADRVEAAWETADSAVSRVAAMEGTAEADKALRLV